MKENYEAGVESSLIFPVGVGFQVEIQCAGADGASILCANHKIELGQLGVIDAAANLLRKKDTSTNTCAHLLHMLLNLSCAQDNQVWLHPATQPPRSLHMKERPTQPLFWFSLPIYPSVTL